MKLFGIVIASLISISGFAQSNETADSIKTEELLFERVEIEASYPGGGEGWKKFLQQNLNANVPVDNGAPIGKYTVMVRFVVSRNGKVSDISPMTALGYGMEQEVVRIIKKSGDWVPAQQNGRNVNAYRKQPITFMITEDGFDIVSKTMYTLFTGMENILSIEAEKVKSEDMKVTISEGSIEMRDDGKFIARVNRPGRVIVEVFNTKKKNVKLGTVSFEVKNK